MDNPVKETDSQVDTQVLDEDGKAARVEPDPRDFPSVGSCELDDIPEECGKDTHCDGVCHKELHFHLFSQFHSNKLIKENDRLTASVQDRPLYKSY